MGNFYVKQPRIGTSPYTRSGLPPGATIKKSGSNEPGHRLHDPMSLELHMADERVRAEGLTPAEREWRQKWLKDQHLHIDEPIHVDAVHRQLNPIRVLYRYPLDKLYMHFLRPTFGTYWGTHIRSVAPKLIMTWLVLEYIYYKCKYEPRDWQKMKGVVNWPEFMVLHKKQEIEENHPGLLELGSNHPGRYGYCEPSFAKRTVMLDVGETTRPW